MTTQTINIINFNNVKVLTCEHTIATHSDKEDTKKSLIMYVITGAVFPEGHAVVNYVVFKGKSNEMIIQTNDIIEAVNAYNNID